MNARGTLVTLEEAARAGARRFVFASTGGALIGDAPTPVDESSLPRPISPYGASKLCGEGYCHAFRGSYGLETVALRFANVYGPRSEHKKGVVTTFVKSALRAEPLVIYGDGSATRDFIYVDDLCAGIAAALASPAAEGVIHLASERETAVSELARLVIDITGADVRGRVRAAAARRGGAELRPRPAGGAAVRLPRRREPRARPGQDGGVVLGCRRMTPSPATGLRA